MVTSLSRNLIVFLSPALLAFCTAIKQAAKAIIVSMTAVYAFGAVVANFQRGITNKAPKAEQSASSTIIFRAVPIKFP